MVNMMFYNEKYQKISKQNKYFFFLLAGKGAADPALGPAAGTGPGSRTARGARMRPDEREVRLVLEPREK